MTNASTALSSFSSAGWVSKVSVKPMASPTVRPLVHLRGDTQEQVQATLTQLRVVNAGAQRLFRRGGDIVRLTEHPDTGLKVIESVHEVTALSTELGRQLRFKTAVKDLNGPPELVVRSILKSEAAVWGLPPLEAVVHVPFFDAYGVLVQENGYHPHQRVWLDKGTLRMPLVPTVPSIAELERAKGFLEELLADCQFEDVPSRNNAIAGIVTPHVREMIQEHVPMTLIMAQRPGAGKTTLARIIGKLAAPGPLPTLPEATSEEEWRKRILSVLRTQPRVVFVDNLNQPLDSSPLAGLITLEVFQDRALGGNQLESHRNRALWMFTANNPQVSPELQRRTSLVVLGSSTASAQNRSYLKDDLFGWLEEQRGELLWAIFTLVQHWVVSGKAPGTVHESGMRDYSQVLGGILETAGFGGVLENMEQVKTAAGSSEEEEQILMHEWILKFGTAEVTATQIATLLTEHEIYPMSLSSHRRNVVGQMLSKLTGYIAHGYIVRKRKDKANHRSKYWLELLPV